VRPRRTARLRLTVLYAGLFLLLGTGLLAITYVLATRSDPIAVSPVHEKVGVVSVLIPGPDPGVVKQLQGQGAAQQKADLARLLTTSWVVLLVTTVGAAGLGWIAAGRVLRPLRAMTTTARTISAGNLHQRLALTGPDDEFKQLGDTFDDLLARLEASFNAQRRFVANASHELRTPLTLERALLQVALADPNASAETLRATCEELLAFGREHERLLESLLTLASSERGLEEPEVVDLAAVTARVLEAHQPAIDRMELQVEAALEPAVATGDPALIERLVANLIDNATEHNVSGGRLEVRTATKAGASRLLVANTGAQIGSEDLARLFEPFQRLGEERAAPNDRHHGLGLSIVRAIAVAHGAQLSARSEPGGGLSVSIDFQPG
jgi:signal transduction histidine kinase